MKNVHALFFAVVMARAGGVWGQAVPGGAGSRVPAASQGVAATGAAKPAAGPVVTGEKKTNTPPVYMGRDPEMIADGDEVITQVIPLNFLSGPAVRDILASVVKTDAPIAAMNSAIVVTETSGVVKRIVQIICYVDVKPGGENVIGMVQLRSGNAAEAAREVNAVMGSQGQ